MDEVVANPSASLTFEGALLRGTAIGYAVCVKPLRFAGLPEEIATTFAEIGDENCYYVFELEVDARTRMERIPSEERLGCAHSIRSVRYFPNLSSRDGPRLDATGHPFGMRGFIVDKSGTMREWRHAGRLGWRDPGRPEDVWRAAGFDLWQWLKRWFRRP